MAQSMTKYQVIIQTDQGLMTDTWEGDYITWRTSDEGLTVYEGEDNILDAVAFYSAKRLICIKSI
jgi:hypothetical protein